jgi:hypothetical protein
MAAKIGNGNVLFRVGSGSPSKVFLGSTAVQTVPGAPTILSAQDSGGTATFLSVNEPADDGGLPLTQYKVYIDGTLESTFTLGALISGSLALPGDFAGSVVEVSAVNAVGEGPKSAPVTVT